MRLYLMNKENLSTELGVSLATINNWIKTKVIPNPDVENYYSKESFDLIIKNIKSDKMRLASRANRSLKSKKEICYLGIENKERKRLLDDLVKDFIESNLTIEEGVLALSIAILRSNNLIENDFQHSNHSKINDLITQWLVKSINQINIIELFSKYDISNFNDDILGAFYQSILNTSQKSNIGSYYTPSKLLSQIIIEPNKTILDPCCGSGGILINVLSKQHDTSKIYARDIDDIALKICFINLSLFFNDKNISANISKQDITLNSAFEFFQGDDGKHFDVIITNPPWGSKYTKQQKEILLTSYLELKTSEIFSISLYNSLNSLKKDGDLFFFLPYSFLNVSTHKTIRKFVFNKNNKIDIRLLGNAFKGVLSECILIHIKKSENQDFILIKSKKESEYQLSLNTINPPNYIVNASSNIKDMEIINKILNTKHITLRKNSIFALGIVTGNNKKYLLSKKI